MKRLPITIAAVLQALGQALAGALARGRAAAARFGGWLSARATTVPFRLAVALACWASSWPSPFTPAIGSTSKPSTASPGDPPHFRNPATDWAPVNWDRLVVSRWDSGNYIELGLRGYQHCPPRGPTLPVRAPGCNLAFYPTYGLVGRYVAKLTRLSIDYALFGGLAALVVHLPLPLDRQGADLPAGGRRDLPGAPLLQRLHDRLLPGHGPDRAADAGAGPGRLRGVRAAPADSSAPLLAGATSGIRITGVAIGMAFAAGLLVELLRERPRKVWPWIRAVLLAVLCVWGQLALMAYHAHRFGDPLTYIHAHGQLFHHDHPGLGALFPPDPEKLIGSIEWPLHEGVWLVAALLWFALGHREALRRFPDRRAGLLVRDVPRDRRHRHRRHAADWRWPG